MTLEVFLNKLKTSPEQIQFADTMAVIDSLYDFTPTAFVNGNTHNAAGQNNGSCKLFSFARLNRLSAEQTLSCFGDYYRQDVLGHPDGSDHQNIRNFMRSGWDGIQFEGDALKIKSS